MRRIRAFCLALVFVTNVVFADADIDNLNQSLQSFQSMQANFTQLISDSNGGSYSNQTGTVILQKPNRFRWEVTGPNQQIFISDGKTLWNVEPDLDQATQSPLVQNLSTTPLLLLSGDVTDISQVFKVTQLGIGQYRLVPTDNDSLIKTVILDFNGNTINRISVVNTMGQTAVVIFSNVQFNVSVPANTFSYTPSKSVELLNQ